MQRRHCGTGMSSVFRTHWLVSRRRYSWVAHDGMADFSAATIRHLLLCPHSGGMLNTRVALCSGPRNQAIHMVVHMMQSP